jgi:hypothetical protein
MHCSKVAGAMACCELWFRNCADEQIEVKVATSGNGMMRVELLLHL